MFRLPIWLQAAFIAVLFIGSLLALAVNAYVRMEPVHDAKARDRLREATRRLSESAGKLNASANASAISESLSERAGEALADFHGVEGGFFLTAPEEAFIGYAFPTGARKRPAHARRNEPPPKELPFIRLQAQESALLAAGQTAVNDLDIGPGRVAIGTRPVGERRPARLVAWTLLRLNEPEQMRATLLRYRVSLGLALAGMVVSALLLGNLGRVVVRQRQEQDLLREELRRSEHLASLGKLLAGVAHEVRNPLAGIRSTVELWQRLPESTQTDASRQAVLNAVDRLNELVARLLVFSRPAEHMEPVDMNALLAELGDLFRAQAEAQSVHIRLELQKNLPPTLGNRGRLDQVLVNLTTNALAAMPTGGVLRLSTRQLSTGILEIEIRDSGHGIDDEAKEKIFEPFFTTRPEGTGLGLSLCREIVLSHGGQIELVESSANGTTFRVSLPVAPSERGKRASS